jgi:predicted nucleic acid-binding Zn ribbon protein
VPADPDRAQRAREALDRAKADARERGEAPVPAAAHGGVPPFGAERRSGGPGGSPPRADTAPRDAANASRARRDDPQPLRAALSGLLKDQGWQGAAAVGSVFGRWPEIVGADLAAHTRPDRLDGGELVVIADSTAWATQVRLLAGTLIRRLNTELGSAAVTRVKVRGPEQPRRPGEWRVRGSRGPRDTYG